MNKTPFRYSNLVARSFKVLAIALALAAWNLRAQQQILSFDFAGNVPTSDLNHVFMYPAGDFAGSLTAGVRTTNWITVFNNTTLTDVQITNNFGQSMAGSNITVNVTGGSGGASNRGSGSGSSIACPSPDTNDIVMYFKEYDQQNGTPGTISVTNVPFSRYDVYCYYYVGDNTATRRVGLFTNLNTGEQRWCVDTSGESIPNSTTGSGYIEANLSTVPASASDVPLGNYVKFANQTNSTLKIQFVAVSGATVSGADNTARLKFSGFQIAQVATGGPTNLYLQSSNLTLHAGNPVGKQLVVLADLETGATGVDETTAPGIAYSVDNTNIATVSNGGLLTPGTNGAANLIVSYSGLSLTNPINVIGPASLSVSVNKTNLLAGNGQGDKTVATLLATFSDATNIPVNSYKFVSFSTTTPSTITINSNGTITALAAGSFSVTGTYDQMSVTTNNAGAVTAYAAPGSVPALSVNLTDSSNPMSFHDLSGAPGARVAYWNNMVMSFGSVTNEIDNPVDYQGNALSGTVVQLMPNNPFNQALLDLGTRTTNESVMFNTVFDQGMNDGTTLLSQIVVSNVPYSSYDVYFYVWNDATQTNRPGEFIIDGVTQYRNNGITYPSTPANDGSGYVIAAPQPTGLPASVTDVPFGNVVKFSGLTDNNLTVQWGAVGQDWIGDANPVTRLRLAGFQIVKSLTGLTATNIYLQSPIPNLLPGSPATFSATVLADFSDGTMGGNITSLSGINYSSSNTGVFTVNTNGVISSGTTPGVATLTVTYQANTLNVNVTNLAPTSVTVKAAPGTVYLDGSLGLLPAQASAYADFPGTNNVNITGFATISFVDQGSPVCSMNSAGVITPNNVQGSADLGVSYLGTTYVAANAFTVTSIANAPVLKHLYLFTNAPDSSIVVDTIGGANGTVYEPLGTNKPISFDGTHAIFPGDGDYTTEPYINLPAGIISGMGDVTVELWGGQTQRNTWSRFFGFGNTAKGLNPHNTGGEISEIELLDSYAGSGHATMFTPNHGADVQAGYSLTNGSEYQLVIVYAPNAGTAAFYINGELIGTGTPTNSPLSGSVNDTVDWLGVSLANNDAPLAGWMNKLAIYEGALSAAQVYSNYTNGVSQYLPLVTVSTVPTNIVTSISDGNLMLTWPADHTGWRLQVQTNSLDAGLGTNWTDVPGSTSVNSMSIPIVTTNGSVFYRLVYP
ncbi:MAG TPA: hypothetical protein VFV23_06375 [Verrucomicrobiae bacterium]|nr:hypothetical protein [Verrucomicrobiae bacterium]